MENENRQLMFAGIDMSGNLESPLLHESLWGNDEGRVSFRVSGRTGGHERDRLNGFAETHIICQDSTFLTTVFLCLHPPQADLLVLHQRHL